MPVTEPEAPGNQNHGLTQAIHASESPKPTEGKKEQATKGAQDEGMETVAPNGGEQVQETENVDNRDGDGGSDSTNAEHEASGNEDMDLWGEQGLEGDSDKPGRDIQFAQTPGSTDTATIIGRPLPSGEPEQIDWNVIMACKDPYEEWQGMFYTTVESETPPTTQPDVPPTNVPTDKPGDDIVGSPSYTAEPDNSTDLAKNGVGIESSVLTELGCMDSLTQQKQLKTGETVIKRLWYRQNQNTIYNYQVFTNCSGIEEANRKYPFSAFSNITQVSRVHGITVYLAKDNAGVAYARFLKGTVLVSLWGRMSDADMVKIVYSMTK